MSTGLRSARSSGGDVAVVSTAAASADWSCPGGPAAPFPPRRAGRLPAPASALGCSQCRPASSARRHQPLSHARRHSSASSPDERQTRAAAANRARPSRAPSAGPRAAGSTAAPAGCAGTPRPTSRRCRSSCRSSAPPSRRAGPARRPPARRAGSAPRRAPRRRRTTPGRARRVRTDAVTASSSSTGSPRPSSTVEERVPQRRLLEAPVQPGGSASVSPRNRSTKDGSLAPERNSSSRNCTDWNPLAGASALPELQEVLRRHRLEHVDLLRPAPARSRASAAAGAGPTKVPAGRHRVAGRRRLVQQLLEPQLVDLVDGDEQQLVVGRAPGRTRAAGRRAAAAAGGSCRRSAGRPAPRTAPARRPSDLSRLRHPPAHRRT